MCSKKNKYCTFGQFQSNTMVSRDLFIKKTSSTPEVILDTRKRTLSIMGVSIPENALTFYEPIVDHLLKHIAQGTEDSWVCRFNFNYYNSSTIISITQMLQSVANTIKDTETKVKIEWCLEDGDDDFWKIGDFMKDIVDLPFEFTKFSTENESNESNEIILSNREAEVLRMIVLGKTTSEIANQLDISNETVKSFRKKLLQKFNVSTMAQVIKIAINEDII